MTRDGLAPRGDRPPERTCVVTRKQGAPADMLRFVAGPGGGVVPDVKRRLPGRGVWTGCERALVAEAVRRKLFARGLGEGAVADAGLPELVDRLLARDALAALSLANKAGAARVGFDKAEELARSGKAAALIGATDAGADGARKSAALARAAGVPALSAFSAAELGAAFGRDHAVHVALAAGGVAQSAIAALRRLARYRGGADAT